MIVRWHNLSLGIAELKCVSWGNGENFVRIYYVGTKLGQNLYMRKTSKQSLDCYK